VEKLSQTLTAAWQAIVLLFLSAAMAAAQTESKPKMIDYSVSWAQPNSHLLEVTIEADTAGALSIDFALPNWRPGRYLIQNFARNIQDFSATDSSGQPLAWIKTEKANWRVDTNKTARVIVRYKYFANILDAGSTLLNDQEVYLNGSNLFMYLAGRRNDACQLKLALPADWRVATALAHTDNNFRAASYDDLIDAPLIASPTLTSYPFTQDGVTYHLAFQGRLDYDSKIIRLSPRR
jgi:predicted metalloprotease with PDZ domain